MDLKHIRLYVDDRPQDGVFRVHRDVYAAPDILIAPVGEAPELRAWRLRQSWREWVLLMESRTRGAKP